MGGPSRAAEHTSGRFLHAAPSTPEKARANARKIAGPSIRSHPGAFGCSGRTLIGPPPLTSQMPNPNGLFVAAVDHASADGRSLVFPRPSRTTYSMHRSFALLAVLALSWSHVAAVRCAMSVAAPSEPAVDAHHEAASHAWDGGSSRSDRHGDTERGECETMLACAATPVAPLRPADISLVPAVAFQTDRFVQEVHATAVRSVDPPPPRQHV